MLRSQARRAIQVHRGTGGDAARHASGETTTRYRDQKGPFAHLPMLRGTTHTHDPPIPLPSIPCKFVFRLSQPADDPSYTILAPLMPDPHRICPRYTTFLPPVVEPFKGKARRGGADDVFSLERTRSSKINAIRDGPCCSGSVTSSFKPRPVATSPRSCDPS